MFNTSDVRKSMGSCAFPLRQQLACAGAPALPNSKTRNEAAGYSPTFTMDASQSYSSSVGQALRSADMLRQLSPTTRVVMLLRNPLDIGRAVYNQLLWDKCGTEECGKDLPPFQTVVNYEMQWLNKSATARRLVERLANCSRPGDARLLELNLLGNWSEWVDRGNAPPNVRQVFDQSLFSLKGLYQPVITARGRLPRSPRSLSLHARSRAAAASAPLSDGPRLSKPHLSQTWLDRFVVPGRPMLVMQAEGYLANAPQYVDEVLGPFLFGAPRLVTNGTRWRGSGSRRAGRQGAAGGEGPDNALRAAQSSPVSHL